MTKPLPVSKIGSLWLIAEQTLPAWATITSPGVIADAILAARVGHALCTVETLESWLAGAVAGYLTKALLGMATTSAGWTVTERTCPPFLADTLPRL